MDFREKREWGRICVTQPLILRSEKSPNQQYKAIAVDVAEENIGFTTEAKLSVGERIQLELTATAQPVFVQAVVQRNIDNLYGCQFAEDDYGKIFKIFTQECLNNIKNAAKMLLVVLFHHKI